MCYCVVYIKYFPPSDPVCQCDSGQCQALLPGQYDQVCSAYGDRNARYECGSCECEVNTGDRCQCQQDGGGGEDEKEKCKADPGDRQECSGHGDCHCGTCVCNSGWVGEHCSCPTEDVPCARGEHVCVEGRTECECEDGWSGESCECDEQDKSGCSLSGSTELCSGHGECRCNECRCSQGFQGTFCQVDTSIDSRERTCDTMEPCILHVLFGNNESIAEEHRQVRGCSF